MLPKYVFPVLVIATLVAPFTSLRSNENNNEQYRLPANNSVSAGQTVWAEKEMQQLSLEQKIGQMLQVRFYGDYSGGEQPEYLLLRDNLRKYHIGSVVFGMHVNRLGFIRPSALDAAKVVNRLQADSELPLLVAADIERGVASRVKGVPSFPWAMAFGAINDSEEVEQFGAISARQARAIGIQWILAPVADVNSNPGNPIINDRSFGENPITVGVLVASYIRGARANGVLVTAKHFPGHGDSTIDSHRGVPSIDGDVDHLRKYELPPFQSAIDAGVDSLMPAHARVSALDSDPNNIATTSHKIVTDVLKNQMGFKGVVITDALEMKGITSLYESKEGSPTSLAAVDAVKAGCDVIMIPTDLDGTFHALLNHVQSGDIPEKRIDDSVRKILALKATVGLDKNRFVDLDQVAARTSKADDFAFAQKISDEAITLVRNDAHLLPLVKWPRRAADAPSDGQGVAASKEKLVVIILAEFLENGYGENLETELKARRPDAEIFRFDGRFAGPMVQQVMDASKSADQIVVASYVVHEAARQSVVNGQKVTAFGLKGLSGRVFHEIVTKYPEKTVVIALGNPYLIENFPQIQTYICTYAMAATSEVSAVKAVFGEIQNRAKLPITLPGVAPLGFSLPWPTQKDQRALQ